MPNEQKEMKGWKVICKSTRLSFSSLHLNPFAIHYPPNVFVNSVAELGNCNLFFFKDKCDAERWVRTMGEGFRNNIMVVPCIAINPRRASKISAFFCNTFSSCFGSKIENFWKGYGLHDDESDAPYGSYVAEQIKCLK